MKINNIQNQSFQGVYRLPCGENTIAEIQREVIPAYNYVRHNNIFVLEGKHPLSFFLNGMMREIARQNNSSIEWLQQNAARHGIELPAESKQLLVFASDKEITNMYEYMHSRHQTKKSFREKITDFFKQHFTGVETTDLPEHLIPLKESVAIDKMEKDFFEKKYDGKIKDVSSPYELFVNIMNEKI